MMLNLRLLVACLLLASLVLVTGAPSALAQRGGGQQDADRDDEDREQRDEDSDDEERGDNDSADRDQRGRSREQTSQAIQQLLQRRQAGQQTDESRQGDPTNRQNQNFGRPSPQQLHQQQQLRSEDRRGTPRIGTWQNGRWQGSRDIDQWVEVLSGEKRPFSDDWYRDHPKAFRHEHDHAREQFWVTATLPGVYTWLNWGNVPPQYNVGRSPRVDLSRFREWYPLGVFLLMSGHDDIGTRIVQLAVNRQGQIKGNYYDIISDSNWSVSGEVSRQSQRVYWSLNKNKSIRFRVPISRLLQPYGSMTVQMPGGQPEWQFVRLED